MSTEIDILNAQVYDITGLIFSVEGLRKFFYSLERVNAAQKAD